MRSVVSVPHHQKVLRTTKLKRAVVETLEERTLLSTVAGLDYSYYQGAFTSLPNFSSLTAIKTGVTHNADISIRNVDTNYAFNWNGMIDITTAGLYTFYAASVDGSEISIDGSTVVNNDGIHAYQEQSGNVNLSAGLHSIGIEYFEASGAQELTVSYAGPGIAKEVIPDSVLSCTAPAVVDVSSFGAVGNGVTNDATAIQNAINATPDGGTLDFDAGKTYLLGTGLNIYRPINIEGNGATLLLDTSAYPNNNQIYYSSPLASTAYTWTGAVAFGQDSFSVPISTNTLLPGDTVFLQLGTDPNDSTQPNYAAVCQVISNTGSVVTLSAGLPAAYANYEASFNQGSLSNSIQRITDVIQNVTVQDLNFNFVSGTTPDAQLWLTMARNVTLNNLTGTATILGNLVDSENVTLSNSSATLDKLTSSAGRLVTGWQDDNLTITNCVANDSYDSPVVFLESWARNTAINNLLVNQTFSGTTSQDVFHFTGDSYGTYADNITIDNNSEVNLVLSGGQYANFSFGTVTISGAIKSAPLWEIEDLITGGASYNQADTITSAPSPVTIKSNWSGHQVALCSGVVEAVTFTLTSWSGESSIIVSASGGGGFDLTPSNLPAGTTTTFDQFYGTDYPLNAPTTPNKMLSFYTSTVPAGTQLSWSITYYQQPMEATAPTATPVMGSSNQFNLSVLGADPYGESALTYTWAAASVPNGATAPAFSVNGTNAAKNSVATFFQIGTYTLSVTITDPDHLSISPTVNVMVNIALASAASATVNTVTGKTAALSMLANDSAGASALTYTWTVSAVPNGNAPPPVFSDNGTATAANMTATFFQAGTYTLIGTATDQSGNAVSSTVNVVVSPIVTQMYIQPGNTSATLGSPVAYSVLARDQYSNPISSPSVMWSATGGTITSGGVYTPTSDGTFSITAVSGSYTAITGVTVTGSSSAPSVPAPPVTGSSGTGSSSGSTPSTGTTTSTGTTPASGKHLTKKERRAAAAATLAADDSTSTPSASTTDDDTLDPKPARKHRK